MTTTATAPAILCTLGPASFDPHTIQRLEDGGASLFRINLSHTAAADVPRLVQSIRRATDARRSRGSGSIGSRSPRVAIAYEPATACARSSSVASPWRRYSGATPTASNSRLPSRGSAGSETASPTTCVPAKAAETTAAPGPRRATAIRA